MTDGLHATSNGAEQVPPANMLTALHRFCSDYDHDVARTNTFGCCAACSGVG